MIVGIAITERSQLNDFMRRDENDGRYYCTICEFFAHKGKTLVRNHIEAKHFPDSFVYNCESCSEQFKNATALNNHKARKHRDENKLSFL